MKTWTNPSVEELEVEMTAGGVPWSLFEGGFLPGIFGPCNPGTPENPGTAPANPANGPAAPGPDATPDGMPRSAYYPHVAAWHVGSRDHAATNFLDFQRSIRF